MAIINATESNLFQSTLPPRGETGTYYSYDAWDYISIHSPAKGRDGTYYSYDAWDYISIHSPAKGRDAATYD